ncbi:DUF2285 domain-containing protein [Mesorhizobium sp.]|uniref:DUF2285 domain-containing protein n=1 Tax=Mesorhizobium sp. TaxID=1871066 RepID=UPI000FE3C245|nr:DUF2285 domain-containing protein [Mesorhizobium sp.]RWQ17652.1 MAG: DUF2285 domain-containing protein [Mesorhizobium sp.]
MIWPRHWSGPNGWNIGHCSTSLRRASTWRAGAFCFADSVARDPAVFWCPRRCPYVLPVVAEKVSSSSPAPPFDLAALPCRATVLLSGDGRQHVLLRHADRHLQLAVSGAKVIQPLRLHIDAIWPAGQLKHRLWALECLNSLRARGRLPKTLFPPDARGRRLRVILQALDGSLAGASQREIAEALIGELRVQADWKDPRDHLRDRIRRAIRRGHSLMNGGYENFLA